MKYIIFGYDGRNTLGQIRSLGVKGVSPVVILVGKRDGVCEASCYCGVIHRVQNEQEGVELLLSNYADATEKSVIYTDSDGVVGTMNANYDRLSQYFFFSNAGEQGRLNQWLDKYEQLLLAKKVGFEIPETVIWHYGDPTPQVSYPVFTKATSSLKNGWKKAAHICNDKNGLCELLKSYESDKEGELLVQQMVTKKDEIYFEGFSICRGTQVFIPLYGGYYRLQPTSYGTYEWLASYNYGEEFLQKLKELFKEIHYEGIFEVEFILGDNDTLYFMEINFRETAFNHMHTLMGANLTWMYAQSVNKGHIINNKIELVKEPFVFMNEFTDFLFYVPQRKLGLKQWINDVRHCDGFIYYDKIDRKPFYHELCKQIRIITTALLKKVFVHK